MKNTHTHTSSLRIFPMSPPRRLQRKSGCLQINVAGGTPRTEGTPAMLVNCQGRFSRMSKLKRMGKNRHLRIYKMMFHLYIILTIIIIYICVCVCFLFRLFREIQSWENGNSASSMARFNLAPLNNSWRAARRCQKAAPIPRRRQTPTPKRWPKPEKSPHDLPRHQGTGKIQLRWGQKKHS